MYKVIKQNPQYEIDLNNDIRRVDGKPLDLNIENEKVYIRLAGFNTRWIDLNWLALITHYNVDRTTISRAIQTGDYIGGYKLTFN